MQPANKSRQYANANNNANNNGNGSNQNQIITSNDGIHTLHHHFFDCQSKPKATLLIVHGMSEHGGRYDAFAQFLAEQGIAVATYDQLGHGKTANCQEELGYVHKDVAKRCGAYGKSIKTTPSTDTTFYYGAFYGVIYCTAGSVTTQS